MKHQPKTATLCQTSFADTKSINPVAANLSQFQFEFLGSESDMTTDRLGQELNDKKYLGSKATHPHSTSDFLGLRVASWQKQQWL